MPRNDKLVKIDGNLIIHSVLASEKAMASHDASKANSKEATGLAIPKDFSPALAIPDVRGNGARHSHFYRNPAERQRAISSGSTDALKDHMKSSAANGKLQQWFQEGLSGIHHFSYFFIFVSDLFFAIKSSVAINRKPFSFTFTIVRKVCKFLFDQLSSLKAIPRKLA